MAGGMNRRRAERVSLHERIHGTPPPKPRRVGLGHAPTHEAPAVRPCSVTDRYGRQPGLLLKWRRVASARAALIGAPVTLAGSTGPSSRGCRLSRRLLGMTLASAGRTGCAVDGRKVLRFVTAAACDVEQVVDLLGVVVSAEVAAAAVAGAYPGLAALPVAGTTRREWSHAISVPTRIGGSWMLWGRRPGARAQALRAGARWQRPKQPLTCTEAR